MTRQQQQTIRDITRRQVVHEPNEARRWEASQAGRELRHLEADQILDRVNDLMARGRTEEARRLVAEWRASKRSN